MQTVYNITPDIWSAIQNISRQYNVDPYTIAAIGQHETGWGALVDHDLYTGFGAFDAGFVQRWAGLESQIRGTARKLQAWGMTQDLTSLEMLQAGNRGDLFDGRRSITGIYATDQAWPDKVWAWRGRIMQKIGQTQPNIFDRVHGYTMPGAVVPIADEVETPRRRVGFWERAGDVLQMVLDFFRPPRRDVMPFWARVMIVVVGTTLIIVLIMALVSVKTMQVVAKTVKDNPEIAGLVI